MTETTTPSHHRVDGADYQRRLRAAGIGHEPPDDIVEFRLTFARRLHMLVNRWHGCPEQICRRSRGCMAPRITCANIEQLPQEEADRQWHAVKGDLYKALKAHLAEHGTEDM